MPVWASVVSSRKGAPVQTIVLERMPDDFKAYLKGNSAIYGCGRSVHQAIGDLILAHREAFELAIERDEQSFKSYGHHPCRR